MFERGKNILGNAAGKIKEVPFNKMDDFLNTIQMFDFKRELEKQPEHQRLASIEGFIRNFYVDFGHVLSKKRDTLVDSELMKRADETAKPVINSVLELINDENTRVKVYALAIKGASTKLSQFDPRSKKYSLHQRDCLRQWGELIQSKLEGNNNLKPSVTASDQKLNFASII